MTFIQAIKSVQNQLSSVSGECALPEAERILTFLLNCSRSELYITRQKELPANIVKKIQAIVERRVKDEPLAYILGSAYFYNREFTVTPDALIPRPDTEILVEEILKKEPPGASRFLDMGTGSGCIAAVLTAERCAWSAVATDLAFPALKLAFRNFNKSVSFLCCDRLSAIKKTVPYRFDFIVSNPPYIASSAIKTLPESVRNFEPHSALDGGDDGLGFYRCLAGVAPPLLKEGGRIYCEIGYDQGIDVPALFESAGWGDIRVTSDLGGHPRVVRAEHKGP